VVSHCVTGGGAIFLGTGAKCGSTDSSGSNPLLTTMSEAQGEAARYAVYLAGLTTTTNLGNITLKKNQSLTVKLGKGINVLAIGNLMTAGSNTIMLSGPASAVVVVNVSGTVSLGATSRITIAGGLNAHNLIWNVESANPIFGTGVGLSGTLLNEAGGTVTFGGGSVINGAVLTNGNVNANAAMHLNFWPFTAAP
jgi:choice-of-anchor A domain-containing protein